MTNDVPITQDALDRLEAIGKERVEHALEIVKLHKEISELQIGILNRRADEGNNAHALAVAAKEKSDQAAVRIQETTVSKAEWHQWKDEINRRLDTTAGAAAASAKAWALIITVGGIILSLILKFWTP